MDTGRPPLRPDDEIQIYRDLIERWIAQGQSQQTMAQHLGIEYQRFCRALTRAGLSYQARKHSDGQDFVRRRQPLPDAPRVRHLAAEGRNLKEIAAATGHSPKSIAAFLDFEGIERRHRRPTRPTNFDLEQAKSLFMAGWTETQIGVHFGLGQSGVSRRFIEGGFRRFNRTRVPPPTTRTPQPEGEP